MTDIAKYFYMPCDVFVMPTHDDTFGMAFLHSLSCGTPVITTNQFACPEIVTHRENGLLVDSSWLHLEDVKFPNRESTRKYHGKTSLDIDLVNNLVVSIKDLYNDRSLLTKLGKKAITDFEPKGKFSIDRRNRELLEIYQSALIS